MKRLHRTCLQAVAAAVLVGCAASPPVAAREAALAELCARPELAGGRIGVCVVDAGSGRELLASHADRGFATASNMKLVGAAVALATLGADHRFPTELWHRGVVENGVMTGELILRGRGDPSFGLVRDGRDAVGELVEALRRCGVTRFVGRIVGDDRWLGDEHLGLGWQWDYLDEDYAAPFGALCCAGNVVTITVRPGGGDQPVVACTPDVDTPLRVDVRQVAATADAVTQLTAHRALGSDVVTVNGTVRADAKPWTVQVPVREPAVFAARVLRSAMVAAGIAVDERPDVELVGDERLVARMQSAPLAELLRHLLLHSDNLWAEQVVRVAARLAAGDAGTAAMAKHVATVLAAFGIDTRGMVVADGSGLSRRNLVQPRQLVGVLAAMWRSPMRAGPIARSWVARCRTTYSRNTSRAGPTSILRIRRYD